MKTQIDIQVMSDRMKKLEKHNRRLTQIGALVLTLGVAGLLMGYAGSERLAGTSAIGETIEAGEFVLRDADGVACAWLKVDGNNSPILMLKKGTAYATLTLADGQAGLGCGTQDGVTWNGVTSRGPNVNFRGKNLKNGAWLGVGNDLAVGLHLYGETLKVGVKLRVEPDGSPVLQLADRFGKPLLTLPNP